MTSPLCWLAHRVELTDTGNEAGVDAWLSTGEAAQLEALRSEARRRDFRLGRWAAKRALALHQGRSDAPEALRDFEIDNDPSGVPHVRWRGRPVPCALSISHRGEVGLATVGDAGVPLGCDVEPIAPRTAEGVANSLVASEQALLAVAAGDEVEALATLFWSVKESALKAWGRGLRVDPRALHVELPRDFTLAAEGSWRSLAVAWPKEDRRLPGWWMRREEGILSLVSGHVERPRLFEE